MRNIKLISIGALTLLSLIIILQNTVEVQTRLLFFSMRMPLALLLFLTALLGFLIGMLVSWRTLRKKEPAPSSGPGPTHSGGQK